MVSSGSTQCLQHLLSPHVGGGGGLRWGGRFHLPSWRSSCWRHRLVSPRLCPSPKVLLPLLLASASNTYSPRPGTAPVLLFLQMSMTAPRIDPAHSSAAEFATKATPPPVAPRISELRAAAPSPPCYFTTEMSSSTPPLESPEDLNALSAC